MQWGAAHTGRSAACWQAYSGWMRVLHAGVAEAGVLLCFQSQAGQARVTRVPINVRRSRRRVRAGRRWHRGIQRRAAQVVQVIQAVEAGARDAGHC